MGYCLGVAASPETAMALRVTNPDASEGRYAEVWNVEVLQDLNQDWRAIYAIEVKRGAPTITSVCIVALPAVLNAATGERVPPVHGSVARNPDAQTRQDPASSEALRFPPGLDLIQARVASLSTRTLRTLRPRGSRLMSRGI
jgi:hypothetical protein